MPRVILLVRAWVWTQITLTTKLLFFQTQNATLISKSQKRRSNYGNNMRFPQKLSINYLTMSLHVGSWLVNDKICIQVPQKQSEITRQFNTCFLPGIVMEQICHSKTSPGGKSWFGFGKEIAKPKDHPEGSLSLISIAQNNSSTG